MTTRMKCHRRGRETGTTMQLKKKKLLLLEHNITGWHWEKEIEKGGET